MGIVWRFEATLVHPDISQNVCEPAYFLRRIVTLQGKDKCSYKRIDEDGTPNTCFIKFHLHKNYKLTTFATNSRSAVWNPFAPIRTQMYAMAQDVKQRTPLKFHVKH